MYDFFLNALCRIYGSISNGLCLQGAMGEDEGFDGYEDEF
jgi:hypothetical protein